MFVEDTRFNYFNYNKKRIIPFDFHHWENSSETKKRNSITKSIQLIKSLYNWIQIYRKEKQWKYKVEDFKFHFSYSKQIKRSNANQNVWKRRIADSYTEMNTLMDASRLLNSTSKGSKLQALSQLDGFVSFYIYEASDKSLIVIAFLSIKYPLTFDFKWLWIEMERKRYFFLFYERIEVATIFIMLFFLIRWICELFPVFLFLLGNWKKQRLRWNSVSTEWFKLEMSIIQKTQLIRKSAWECLFLNELLWKLFQSSTTVNAFLSFYSTYTSMFWKMYSPSFSIFQFVKLSSFKFDL